MREQVLVIFIAAIIFGLLGCLWRANFEECKAFGHSTRYCLTGGR